MVDSKILGLYQDESSPSGGFDWNLDMKECEANIKKLDDAYDKLHEILANASIDGYGEELPNLTHSFSMYGSSGRPFHS